MAKPKKGTAHDTLLHALGETGGLSDAVDHAADGLFDAIDDAVAQLRDIDRLCRKAVRDDGAPDPKAIRSHVAEVERRSGAARVQLEALVRIMRQLDEHAAAYAEEEAS